MCEVEPGRLDCVHQYGGIYSQQYVVMLCDDTRDTRMFFRPYAPTRKVVVIYHHLSTFAKADACLLMEIGCVGSPSWMNTLQCVRDRESEAASRFSLTMSPLGTSSATSSPVPQTKAAAAQTKPNQTKLNNVMDQWLASLSFLFLVSFPRFFFFRRQQTPPPSQPIPASRISLGGPVACRQSLR